MAESAFETLTFRGIPLVMDRNVPSNTWGYLVPQRLVVSPQMREAYEALLVEDRRYVATPWWQAVRYRDPQMILPEGF